MDSVYKELSDRALKLLEKSNSYRILILVAGAPASGKSTIAKKVCDEINQQYCEESSVKFSKKNGDEEYKQDDFFKKIDNYVTNEVVKDLKDCPSCQELQDVDQQDVENEEYLPSKKQVSSEEIVISARSVGNCIKLKVPEESGPTNFAQIVPMDGFHLPRKSLNQFKDTKHAFARRGAPFTFDSAMVAVLAKLLKSTCNVILAEGCEPIFLEDEVEEEEALSLSPDEESTQCMNGERTNSPSRRSSFSSQIFDHSNNLSTDDLDSDNSVCSSLFEENPEQEQDSTIWQTIDGTKTMIPDIYIPNFDHSLKDPSPGEIVVRSTTRVVIMEGLYLLLNQGMWKSIGETSYNRSCESWKVEVDEQVARYRIAKRHLEAGIVSSLQEGERRYDTNDCLNGRLVDQKSVGADVVIKSVDE